MRRGGRRCVRCGRKEMVDGQEKAGGSRQERTSPRAPCPKRQPRRSFSTAVGQPRRQECGESRNSIALLARLASCVLRC